MNAGAPFQPKVLVALVAALIGLFAASLLLMGAGGKRAVGNKIGANSYSHSAVGHLGFLELLRGMGRKVARGDSDPVAAAGRDGILVLAEPTGTLSGEETSRKLLSAPRILLVLPKWRVYPDVTRDDWIGRANLAPEAGIQSILYAVAGPGEIARAKPHSAFTTNLSPAASAEPTVEGPLQLIKNSRLKPLIATADGVLLGEFNEANRTIWVLADPDPIENHGVGKGDNIAFDEAMINAILGGRAGPLVFDETIHGFRSAPPNALAFLLGFPFNLIALQVLMGVVLLLWAAMGRFGAPEMAWRALESGKKELIGNAASLLDHAGHHAPILRRYASMEVRETGRVLRAPSQLHDDDLAAWLDRVGEARGVKAASRALLGRVATLNPRNLSALLGEARIIHRWKKDMLHGVSRRLRDH